MEITQINRKLNYKKVSLFYVKEKRNNVNFKMKLLNWIRLYFIFYVKRLESADSKISIRIKESLRFSQYNKYKIEKIKDYDLETHQYIIK